MEIQQQIQDTIKHMTALETEYSKALSNRTIREGAFKMAYATAFLKAEGTIPDRKESAVLATQKEYTAWQEEKTRAAIFKEKLEDCRSALWAIREVQKSENQVFTAHGQFQT